MTLSSSLKSTHDQGRISRCEGVHCALKINVRPPHNTHSSHHKLLLIATAICMVSVAFVRAKTSRLFGEPFSKIMSDQNLQILCTYVALMNSSIVALFSVWHGNRANPATSRMAGLHSTTQCNRRRLLLVT